MTSSEANLPILRGSQMTDRQCQKIVRILW